MNWQKHKFDCSINYSGSLRSTPFYSVRYTFNYLSDKVDQVFLDNIIKKGKALALKVNSASASASNFKRKQVRININAIAGLLAEDLWLDFLNSQNIPASSTPFSSASNQIDIVLPNTGKTIEVRSSFPRNGVEFALCHAVYQFDVIGPYSNDYKPSEIQKDFYVRVLFPFSTNDFFSKLKSDSFEVYLTGGATWSMMSNNNIALVKSFIAEDELNADIITASKFRVVPFSQALDSFNIINYM